MYLHTKSQEEHCFFIYNTLAYRLHIFRVLFLCGEKYLTKSGFSKPNFEQ